MVSNRTMEKVVEQYEKLIERQQKEIDDLRNRLAAHSYVEYAQTRDTETQMIEYPPHPTYDPGTITPVDSGFPAR